MALLSHILHLSLFLTLFHLGLTTVKSSLKSLHQKEIFMEHSTQLSLSEEDKAIKNKWLNSTLYLNEKNNHVYKSKNQHLKQLRIQLYE